MVYLFSDFELDDRLLELRKGGSRVPIEPKPLRLLLDLVAHAPALRSHEELLRVVWTDEVVTDASLARAISALRRALGEPLGAPRFIETVRGRGYHMSVRVERALSEPRGAQKSSFWQDLFVGRAAILSRLEELFAGAENRRGSVVLLAGEPGIGKTRTAEILAERARSRGAEVYWGRASETPGADSYSPWSNILRLYLETHPGHDPIPTESRRGDADLSALLPERRQLAGRRPPREPQTEQARFALFEGVTDFFRRASRESPLLLVLDDLHWMDQSSLRLLSFLARQVGEMRLLILGTYRAEAALGGELLAEVLAGFAALPHVEPAFALEGLSRDDISVLLATALNDEPTPDIVDSVHQRTGGNPFFVRELTRQFVAAGGVVSGLVGPPPTVRQVVAGRARHLGVVQRAVLEAVAVVDRETPLALLTQVTGLGPAEVLDALEVLSTANLLVLRGGPAPRARYVHAIAREALYETLPPSRRIELHGAVADALESLAPRTERPAAEIAHHYIEAAPIRGIEPALKYIRLSAEDALRRVAAEEAVQLLERGLEILELDPAGVSRVRCDLLLALGLSLDAAGRRSEARNRYADAAQIARAEGAGLQFAAATLGCTRHLPGYVVVGQWDVEGIAMLDEAVEGLGSGEQHLRLELLAALLPKLYWAGDEGRERAGRLSREVVEEARRQGSERLRALCICRRHLLLWHPEGLEERLTLAREAIGLADPDADPFLALEARFLRIVDLLELGEVAPALNDIDFYEQLAGEIHQPSLVIQALSWWNAWAHAEARVEEMEQGIEQALELAQDAKVPTARYTMAVQQAILDWTHDDLGPLDPLLETVAEAQPALASSHAVIAWLAAEAGDDTLTATHLEALEQGAPQPVSLSFDGLFIAAAKATAVHRLEDLERARRLYAELLPDAHRHVVGLFGTVLLGSASRYLGQLATTLGLFDEAERHFEEARAANWRTGAVTWAAHTLCDHAQTLLHRGGPDDLSRVRHLVDEVEGMVNTSDLACVARRVREIRLNLTGIRSLPRRPSIA